MNTTLKSQSSFAATLFWALIVLAICIGSVSIGWVAIGISGGFLVPTSFAFRFYRTQYIFEEDCLLILDPLEKVEIPYSTIRGAELIKANLLQRLIGFPREVVSLKYNKFDDRLLINGSAEMLDEIYSNLSNAASSALDKG